MSVRRCLEQLLGGRSVGHALDVGCGDGEFTRLVAECGRARSIIGIDPDKESIDEARRLTDSPCITYRIVSVHDLRYPDARFDTIVVSNALHHLADAHGALAIVARLLQSDGTLLVRELVADGLSDSQLASREVHHFKALIDTTRGRYHAHTYSRDALRELLVSSGYSIDAECEPLRGKAARGAAARGGEAAAAIEFVESYRLLARASGEERAMIDRECERVVQLVRDSGVSDPPELLLLARPIGR